LEPQHDGTLKGVDTLKTESDECGFRGLVMSVPLVATRVGEVPPSVVLADPALF
jgi:serine/threonine-protein kinase